MKILKKAKELFDKFNKNGINYCHWKSNEHLLEGLSGKTDLDVLVDKKQSEFVTKILLNTHYIRLNPQFGSRYPDVEDWLACDEEARELIHIHLHYDMVTGHAGLKEYSLPWKDLALSTRVFNKEYEVYTIEPNLEIAILLTRIGLKTTIRTKIKAIRGQYILSDDDIRELQYLKNLVEKNTIASIIKPYYEEKTDHFLNLIDCEEYKSKWIKNLISITNCKMRRYTRYNSIVLVFLKSYYACALFVRRVLRKLFCLRIISKKCLPRGSNITIAIIGQDGAGKSTIIRDLYKWLSWKFDVQKYYMGCGDGYNSIFKKLLHYNSDKLHNNLFSSILTIFNYVNVSKNVKKNIKSAQLLSYKGSIVLYDRYPQNQFYGINDGPKIREIINNHKTTLIVQKIMMKLAKYEEKNYDYAVKNAPLTVIKLLLPPAESIKRKPCEKKEDVEKKSYIIDNLSFPDSEVIKVDATMDYNKEILLIRDAVWRTIEEKKYIQ